MPNYIAIRAVSCYTVRMNTTVSGKDFGFAHTRTPRASRETFFRHVHTGYELLYFQKGRAHYVVEDKRYTLYPHTLVFIRPNEYHYLDLDAPCEYERIIFNFSERFVPPEIKPELDRRAHVFRLDRTDLVEERFLSLARYGDLFPAEALEGLLSAALREAVYLYALTAPVTEPAETDDKIIEVLGYLNERLTGPISLESTAKAVFLSPSRLSHLFSEHMKIGVMQYVALKRIALAEDLLSKNVRPAEVAERTGFQDYSIFYRTYRRLTGKSPSGRSVR